VIHRDVKLDNVLLCQTTHPSGILMAPVKLCDFGVAVQMKGTEKEKDGCGTLSYAAPEVINNDMMYDTKADVWSAGVVTYALLAGCPPFESENRKTLKRLILSGKFSMESDRWENISVGAKELVKIMLTVQQDRRWSAEQVLHHPWFDSIGEDFELSLEDDWRRRKCDNTLD